MNGNQTPPKHVAVPVEIWHATIEFLTTEKLSMKKIEAIVVGLRQCQSVQLSSADEPKVPAGVPKEE